jgi:hypothetical protein
VYADTDVECMFPIDTHWLNVTSTAAMVVGVEAEFDTLEEATRRTYARQKQVRQR